MAEATYRNFGHYISEGWSSGPKQSFQKLAGIVEQARGRDAAGELLDVGCATGELLAYLSSAFPRLRGTGIDMFEPLLEEARRLLPGAHFVNASALEIPERLCGAFDVVTAIGVMSVFDESEIGRFWRNLISAARPGGLVIVLSPLNEHGVDTMIRHRKRSQGAPLQWEAGWNIHSVESIRETVAALGHQVRFERFVFQGSLSPREDPVRTWTMATEKNPRQLTNGLKLLIDHYFMIVEPGKTQE